MGVGCNQDSSKPRNRSVSTTGPVQGPASLRRFPCWLAKVGQLPLALLWAFGPRTGAWAPNGLAEATYAWCPDLVRVFNHGAKQLAGRLAGVPACPVLFREPFPGGQIPQRLVPFRLKLWGCRILHLLRAGEERWAFIAFVCVAPFTAPGKRQALNIRLLIE